jgi:hypothetical protein
VLIRTDRLALKKAGKRSRPQKQMLFPGDGNNDPSWFSRFENDDYFIGFFALRKKGLNKVIASSVWGFY